MKIEILTGQAEMLEKIFAQANTDGQSLSDIEQRCLKAAFDPDHGNALAQVEKEFPSKEAFDEFVARAGRLIERTLLHAAESRPEMTSEVRAKLEKFMTGRGEAVVGSVISMTMFGRMPAALRALGIVVLIVPLAAIVGTRLYADLAAGRMDASSRTIIQFALALVAAAAVWSIFNLVSKLNSR